MPASRWRSMAPFTCARRARPDAVGPHHRRAHHDLRDGGHASRRCARAPRVGGDEPPLQQPQHEEQRRRHGEGDEGEQPVVDEHRDGDGDHQRAVEQPGDAAPRRRTGDSVSMSLGDPGDERAAALLGVVGDRQLVDVGEGARPQPVEGLLAAPARRTTAARLAKRGDDDGDGGDDGEADDDADVDRRRREPLSIDCWTRIGTTMRPPAPTNASSDGEPGALAQLGAGPPAARRSRALQSSRAPGRPRAPVVELAAARRSCRAPVALVGLDQVAVAGADRASRSAWRPWATTRPSTRNTTSSARAMVDGRLATIDGRDAVRARAREAGEDQRLGGRVEAGRGVVEQQHAGAGARGRGRGRSAGAGRPTGVTPRSPTTVSSAVRQLVDEAGRLGELERLAQPSRRCSVEAEERRSRGSTRRTGTAPGTPGRARRARRRPCRRRGRRRPAITCSSVVLPAPVGPTTATVRAAREPQVDVVRARRGRPRRRSGRRGAATPTPGVGAADGLVGARQRRARRGRLRTRSQPASEWGRSAEDEADQPQRPHQQREQVDEAGDVADRGRAGLHPVGADHDEQRRWRAMGTASSSASNVARSRATMHLGVAERGRPSARGGRPRGARRRAPSRPGRRRSSRGRRR